MNTMTITRRLLTTAVLAGTVALVATGCSAEELQQEFGDAWAVTYEVTVDQPVGAELRDVDVEGAEVRGDDLVVHELGAQTTDGEADGGAGSSWHHDSIVYPERPASMSATPPQDATATCRVLLDGVRELASATSSAPGEPVRCALTMPAYTG